MNNKYIQAATVVITIALGLSFSGCSKQDEFLDAKSDQKLIVPETLDDYQLLLNNESVFNSQADPGLPLVSSESYYVLPTTWSSLFDVVEKNAYIWAKDLYEGSLVTTRDWSNPYSQVYYANTILDGLSDLTPSTSEIKRWNEIKGAALFYRSYAFYSLVQAFSVPFDSATFATDPGIPIRLSSDLNIKSTRSSVKHCYDQILSDLEVAISLLPTNASLKTQPSKLTANALLARIYLSIGNYEKAYQYANESLQINSTLTDYNTLTPTNFTITTAFLEEDIFHRTVVPYLVMLRSRGIIDSTLYKSYATNDLRRSHFFINFNGQIRFRGSYDFRNQTFSGLANDEIYLIRAESSARLGRVAPALEDLNTLLKTRFNNSVPYVPITAANKEEALAVILKEREKELLYRGLQWTDLRRLNKKGNYNRTITRVIDNNTYKLVPNDARYALPIPVQEIQLSNLEQNPR
ncbi:RagB/SusD family nutrient uptake outer membrane protein [Chitinophaga rhizophila]|uniref:RagB/SusD family nutrient uptake outer membrane protein n=1 Tax=Chitinophaga rhizophila TaxID=2866212 RepID=A0ABS7GAC7_9BACT|nr:RagB/SusD family nutrient uptake outer membrane protein [Chitinophaga rhizophila]MBW8683488.1 RagB/SusD family nutrient uptake outer membrane protein [Chitinophaga rhizophila]